MNRMNQNSDLEWLTARLSAYYDGELSAEERKRVEELLPNYPEAETALKRFSTIGEAIKCDPALELSPHRAKAMRENLMAHIEREAEISRFDKPMRDERSNFWQKFFTFVSLPLASAAATAIVMYIFVLPQKTESPLGASKSAAEVVVIQPREELSRSAPQAPFVAAGGKADFRAERKPSAFLSTEQAGDMTFIEAKGLNYYYLSPPESPDASPIVVVLVKGGSNERSERLLSPSGENRIEVDYVEAPSGQVTVIGGGGNKVTIILVEGAEIAPIAPPKKPQQQGYDL